MIAPADTGLTARVRGTLLGLCALLLLLLVPALPAQAQFGLDSFSTTLHQPAADVPVPGAALVPANQAGAHPDLTTRFTVTATTTPNGTPVPSGALKDADITLPAGFYGNPRAIGQCPDSLFNRVNTATDTGCLADTQIGWVAVTASLDPADTPTQQPVYNLAPLPWETAAIGFGILGSPIRISIAPRAEENNALVASVRNTSQALSIYGIDLTLWGNPADPVHDCGRFDQAITNPPCPALTGVTKPFLTAPPHCDGPLVSSIRARSWGDDTWVEREHESPALTGCEQLAFGADLSLKPDNAKADSPAQYTVEMDIPQDETITGLGTPHLKTAVVKLPEGVAIAPPSAAGLKACADVDSEIGTSEEPNCPAESKIGTVEIDTPLLAEPLVGEAILREPKPGNLFRLMLVVRGPGLIIKLPGDIVPDKTTGQITATFDNTPQLPFSHMTLTFKGGPRAPLSNPQTCGTKTTTTALTPYAGAAATPSSSFDITECSGGFAPSFEAGTINPFAGAHSPFSMTIRRADGQEDINSLVLDMPPGLLGTIKGIPQCPEAQAAAGTCGDASRVGSTTVESGAGPNPFSLPGKVFLAGPYKGAPFSLSVVVRAIAGPFDLGTVVVRAPINVDAANAKLGVPSDPLPRILEGVPLRLRMINIAIDRPGFMFNATNCTPASIQARIGSTAGTVVQRGSAYNPTGCASLPLQPKLEMTLRGAKEVKDGKHPGLDAKLTQAPGESGLKKVSVKLPLSLALDPDNAQALCKPGEAAARACPAGSIVGRATATTPALNLPLSGPIYFVENTRVTASGNVVRTLPKLWLALRGEVPLDLTAESTVVDDHLVATFSSVPDAPISSFELSIDGGKNGILAATQSICEKAQVSDVTFDGQSGKRVKQTLALGNECGFRVAGATRTKTSVTVTVSGLGAGKLEVSGKGLAKTTRTIKLARIAKATAKLTKEARRTVSRKGRFSTRVSVKFTPAGGGKVVTTGAKVTFKK